MKRTLLIAAWMLVVAPAVFAAGEMPPGYQVLRQTDAGLLMMTTKAKPLSLAAATESTLTDLDHVFDDDYDYDDSFEDQKTHASLLTGLKAKYHGKKVRGLIVARKSESGANIFVAFVNEGADRSAWAALTAAAPPAANDKPAPAAAAKPIALHDYRFPDNTGVIGLADGYTTNAASCGSAFQVMGQGGQELTFGFTASVSTPNSTAVQLARQYPTAYNATMLVAPYADPGTVLNTLVPQLSRITQAQGSYATTIDHLRKVSDAPPMLQNQTAAVFSYGATRTTRGRNQHFQVMALLSVTPIGNEAFMFSATTLAAPDTTFQQDLPAMLAIAGSIRENAGQIMQNTKVWVDQRNAWFAGVQGVHNTQVQGGEDYIHNAEKNSNETLKSVTDFDETIRGHRTVEDTTTGERTEVNLGDVDQVVDSLNKQEPGRYRPIKLRDQ